MRRLMFVVLVISAVSPAPARAQGGFDPSGIVQKAQDLEKGALRALGEPQTPWDCYDCEAGALTVRLPFYHAYSAKIKYDQKRTPIGATFEARLPSGVVCQVSMEVLDRNVANVTEARAFEILRDHGPPKEWKHEELRRRYSPHVGLETQGSVPASVKPSGYARQKSVLIGRRVYTIRVIGKDRRAARSAEAFRFYDSLRLGKGALDLNDLRSPPELVEFYKTPLVQDVLRNSSPAMIEFKKELDNRVQEMDVKYVLSYDPTTYVYSAEDRTAAFLQHLDDIDKEIADPKTPAARRAELQLYSQARMDFFRRANIFHDRVWHEVLRANEKIQESNRHWARVTVENQRALQLEMAAQSLRESVWRLESLSR